MIAFLNFVTAAILGLIITHWAHDVVGAGAKHRTERARAWAAVVGPALAAVGVLGALISALVLAHS